jgi:hypothetical protein
MSKLASISSNETLINFSQGAAKQALSPVADFLAPTVNTAWSIGRFKKYTSTTPFDLPNTLRNPGERATEIGFDLEDSQFKCEPHAIDFPVDVLEKIELLGVENVMQEAALTCSQIGGLSHEIKVISLALKTLGAGESLATGPDDDIIDQIDEKILAVIKAARFGALMNVGLLFGANMWRKVKNHPSVRSRFISANGSKFANPSVQDFCDMLIAKAEARIGLACYNTAAPGLPTNIEFILDDDLIIFARLERPTRYDPSFMKTFRLANRWMVPGSYMREDGRAEVAKFDWSADPQVTNPDAGFRFKL